MARKIRFPLKMKNGAEVRSLDELKENFDLESVLGYFTDGKLATWLSDRYYDEKAKAVSALSKDMPDLNAKLCDILEVEYQEEDDDTDLEYIQRRNEKLRILSAFTDDKEILDNIDIVALNQVDLYDVLDRCNEKVYLYENKFEIPFGRKNICYIGLSPDRVVVSIEKEKYLFEYIDAGITFHNIEFDSSINQYVTKGEILLKNNKYEEAIPLINEAIKENNIRAYFWGKILSGLGIGNIEINEEIDISDFKDIPSDSAENLILAFVNDVYEIDIDDIDKLKDIAFSGDFIAAFFFVFAKLEDNSIDNEIIEMIELNNNALLYYVIAEWLEEEGSEENIVIKYYEKSYKLGLYASLVKLFDLDYISEDDVTEPDIQYHLGKEYYNSEEDDEAVKWFIKAAEQGNADALVQLSIMIHEDKTIFDDTERVRWYKLVAEQGYAKAQYELGDCYYIGKGIEQDKTKAVEWYRKAAEQGYADAQKQLGDCYYYGLVIEQDKTKAVEWYRKAAEQGNADAQKQLGYMYENGYGVTPDKITAEDWYCKARENYKPSFSFDMADLLKEAEEEAKKGL